MNLFNRLPEFEKEFSKLSKKYPSLIDDLKKFERFISLNPVGAGVNFVTIYHVGEIRIVKSRLACKSLRKRSMRVIYAFHDDSVIFVYIELYFKGDKENEDSERIKQYIKNIH